MILSMVLSAGLGPGRIPSLATPWGMPQVPILDPGIHVQPGYAPYDSGMADAVFIHDISGKPFMGQVRTRCASAAPSSCATTALLVRVIVVLWCGCTGGWHGAACTHASEAYAGPIPA